MMLLAMKTMTAERTIGSQSAPRVTMGPQECGCAWRGGIRVVRSPVERKAAAMPHPLDAEFQVAAKGGTRKRRLFFRYRATPQPTVSRARQTQRRFRYLVRSSYE